MQCQYSKWDQILGICWHIFVKRLHAITNCDVYFKFIQLFWRCHILFSLYRILYVLSFLAMGHVKMREIVESSWPNKQSYGLKTTHYPRVSSKLALFVYKQQNRQTYSIYIDWPRCFGKSIISLAKYWRMNRQSKYKTNHEKFSDTE